MYMTTKASYTSVHSKSILTPLLQAFLPSLSEKGSQVLHSIWRWGETFLSAVLTLALSWAVKSHSLLGWGPRSFSIPINCLRHSFATSRFVAPQSVGKYKLVVSHKQWLYLQVPLNTQRTGAFYFLKSYEAKMLRTVLTDALRGQDTDWWFQTHASFWVIEVQVSLGEHHHFVTRPAVCLLLSPPHRELESKLLMEVQHVYCPL